MIKIITKRIKENEGKTASKQTKEEKEKEIEGKKKLLTGEETTNKPIKKAAKQAKEKTKESIEIIDKSFLVNRDNVADRIREIRKNKGYPT